MEKEEVIGRIALIQYERKEKLRRKITDPAYKYYFRGVRRTLSSIIFILISVALLGQSFRDISFPITILFLVLFVAFSEIARQRERFNALVDLIEIEKEENIKCEPSPAGNPASQGARG